MEYLNNVRLFHAVDELMYSDKNLTHIAYDNGFPTSASFTKTFRDVYKDSPSEYRKKMQEENVMQEKEIKLQEEKESRILEYLRFREKKESPQSTKEKEYVTDAKKSKEHILILARQSALETDIYYCSQRHRIKWKSCKNRQV